MEKDLVSVYRPPFSSAYIPTESITLEEVWERITDRGLQDQTTALRILLQEGRKEEYKTPPLLSEVLSTIAPQTQRLSPGRERLDSSGGLDL